MRLLLTRVGPSNDINDLQDPKCVSISMRNQTTIFFPLPNDSKNNSSDFGIPKTIITQIHNWMDWRGGRGWRQVVVVVVAVVVVAVVLLFLVLFFLVQRRKRLRRKKRTEVSKCHFWGCFWLIQAKKDSNFVRAHSAPSVHSIVDLGDDDDNDEEDDDEDDDDENSWFGWIGWLAFGP
jgi:hypothetical protein